METGARCPYALPASPRAIPSFCLGPAQLSPHKLGGHYLEPRIPAGRSGNYPGLCRRTSRDCLADHPTAQCIPGFMLRPHLAGRHMMLTGKHGALHYA